MNKYKFLIKIYLQFKIYLFIQLHNNFKIICYTTKINRIIIYPAYISRSIFFNSLTIEILSISLPMVFFLFSVPYLSNSRSLHGGALRPFPITVQKNCQLDVRMVASIEVRITQ